MQLTYSALCDLNAEVNAEITYTPDAEKYNRPDWWEDALDEGNAGDCEDAAIAKLRLLLAAGWPRDHIGLALCWDENGRYHAVLLVTLNGADVILDNRTDALMLWTDSAYRWDRVYSLADRQWHAVMVA